MVFFSSMSYRALAYLCPGVTVDLFDPCEIPRTYELVHMGVSTWFNHYASEKNYNEK